MTLKRSQVKALAAGWVKDLTVGFETLKARMEHPFHLVENLFPHRKGRCRGLARNAAQLHTFFALANLMIVQRALPAPGRT